MAKVILTAQLVRELLDYDLETGIFTRKVRLAQCHQIGDRADWEIKSGNPSGYRKVTVDSRSYMAHRVAWLYVYGSWPKHQLDHINGKRGDNRIANLRDVTAVVNLQNTRRARKSSGTGVQGPAWYPASGKYRAQIRVNGKSKHIGMYATIEEAHQAFLKAKRKYHEGCTI